MTSAVNDWIKQNKKKQAERDKEKEKQEREAKKRNEEDLASEAKRYVYQPPPKPPRTPAPEESEGKRKSYQPPPPKAPDRASEGGRYSYLSDAGRKRQQDIEDRASEGKRKSYQPPPGRDKEADRRDERHDRERDARYAATSIQNRRFTPPDRVMYNVPPMGGQAELPDRGDDDSGVEAPGRMGGQTVTSPITGREGPPLGPTKDELSGWRRWGTPGPVGAGLIGPGIANFIARKGIEAADYLSPSRTAAQQPLAARQARRPLNLADYTKRLKDEQERTPLTLTSPLNPKYDRNRPLVRKGEAYKWSVEASDFQDGILEKYFSPYAQQYLAKDIGFKMGTRPAPEGGGGFYPNMGSGGTVTLRGTQEEAAVHEFSHAWWEQQGHNNPTIRDQFINDVRRFATTGDASKYPLAAQLARVYVNGDPSTGFPGMLENGEWNDDEMYAGLASGVMGDLSQLPPELRKYYKQFPDRELIGPTPTPFRYGAGAPPMPTYGAGARRQQAPLSEGKQQPPANQPWEQYLLDKATEVWNKYNKQVRGQAPGVSEAQRFGLEGRPQEPSIASQIDLTAGVPAATAAFDYDVRKRRQEYADPDVVGFGAAAKQAGMGGMSVLSGIQKTAMDVVNPEKSWRQVGEDVLGGVGGLFGMLGAPLMVHRIPAYIAQGTGNVGSALQVGTDVMAGAEMPNDLTVGENMATAGRTFVQAVTTPGAWNSFDARRFIQPAWVEQARVARESHTFTPEQIKNLTPEQRNYYLSLARKNWANPEAVKKTMADLADREKNIRKLQEAARIAFEAGNKYPEGAERNAAWGQASDLFRQAYELEHSHPMELVYKNTDVLLQLIGELAIPDPTDLAGGLLHVFGLTPKARRLTGVAQEFIQDDAKIERELAKLTIAPGVTLEKAVPSAVTPASMIRNFLGLNDTAASMGTVARRDIMPVVSTVLSDAETKADAKLLLGLIARDPLQLVKGIPAYMLQSEGFRVAGRVGEDGLVRFGSSGMNTQQFVNALQDFRLTAEEMLRNAPSLNGEGEFNKLNFLMEDFLPAVEQGAYRRGGKSTAFGDAPLGTINSRVKTTRDGAFIEYLGKDEKVLGQSDVMTLQEANRTAASLKGERNLFEKNVASTIGNAERRLVTPMYLILNPGAWATNYIAANMIAMGDGTFAWGNRAHMTEALQKLYGGILPTDRSLTGMSAAAEMAGKSTLQKTGNWLKQGYQRMAQGYGALDELTGTRVIYKTTMDFIDKTLPPQLQKFAQTLVENGMPAKDANKMAGHLHEVARQGGNMFTVLNDMLSGKVKPFSVGAINKNWLEVLAAGGEGTKAKLDELINTVQTPEQYTQAINAWADEARKPWETQVRASSPELKKRVWTEAGNAQDAGDLEVLRKRMVKNGVPEEEASTWYKAAHEQFAELEQKQTLLTKLVTDTGIAENRKVLYDIWAQIDTWTTAVRRDLAERMRPYYAATMGMDMAQQSPIFQEMVGNPIREAWAKRNQQVNDLLERGLEAVQSGTPYKSTADYWDRFERALNQNAEKLKQTMAVEVGSGRRDARLGESIQAGHARVDQEVARTFALANQLDTPGSFDIIASAEANIQHAGANMNAAIEEAFQEAAKSNDLTKYTVARNKIAREMVEHEIEVYQWAQSAIIDEARGANKVIDETAGQAAASAVASGGTAQARAGGAASVSEAEAVAVDAATPGPVLNLGNTDNVTDVQAAAKKASDNATALGGAIHPDHIGEAGVYALDQIEALRKWLLEHPDEVLQGTGTMSPAQSMKILNEFRQKILPVWDTIRSGAAKYSDKMRSFTLIDGARKTQADALLSIFQPYGFFFTRTVKNTLERMVFEPHIFKRIMNYQRKMRQRNEQAGLPDRADDDFYVEINGDPYFLGLNVTKYEPTLESLLFNEYAEPSEANNAVSFAFESAAASGINGYAWWGAGAKALDKGNVQDIYPADWFPWGKAIATQLPRITNALGGNAWQVPEWLEQSGYEYHLGKEVENMFVKEMEVNGQPITRDEMMQAQQLLYQRRQNTPDLPEQKKWDYNRLNEILNVAALAQSGQQGQVALEQNLAGVTLKPYDQAEGVAIDERDKFFRRQYDPVQNPYGTQQEASDIATGAMGPGNYYKYEPDTTTPPGVSLSTAQSKEANVAIDEKLKKASDDAINLVAKNDGTRKEMEQAGVQAAIEAAKEYVPADVLDKWVKESEPWNSGLVAKFVKDWTEKNTYPSAWKFPDKEKYNYDPLNEQLPVSPNVALKDKFSGYHNPDPGMQKLNVTEEQERGLNGILYNATHLTPTAKYPGEDEKNQAVWDAYTKAKANDDAAEQKYTLDQLTGMGYSETEALQLLEEYKNRFQTEAQAQRLGEIGEQSAASRAFWDEYHACGDDSACKLKVRNKSAANEAIFQDFIKKQNGEGGVGGGGGTQTPEQRAFWNEYHACGDDKECKLRVRNKSAANEQIFQDYLKSKGSTGGSGGASQASVNFRAARNNLSTTYGADAVSLFDQYHKLPAGAARDEFKAEHPEIALYNFSAYNPNEYKEATDLFGEEGLQAWANRPTDKEELRTYYDENPTAFLVQSWMWGRPANFSDQDEASSGESGFGDYGKDFAEATDKFGSDIWDTVASYQRGWDKAQKRAFYDAHPEYADWQTWWYGDSNQVGASALRSGPGYDSLGHRAFGHWDVRGHGGGGGGGGGYGGGLPRDDGFGGMYQGYKVDMPYVQPYRSNIDLSVRLPDYPPRLPDIDRVYPLEQGRSQWRKWIKG